ncbi:MAG: TldD/PmbA family protein [Mycobacteriales bacterium]
MELAHLADFARDDVRKRGVDYADVRAISSESESIDVRDGDVQGVGRASSCGIGIRALVNGSWGFASTNSSDEADVRRAAERAVDIARASGTVQRDKVRLDDTPPPAGRYVTPHTRDPFDVPLAEKVEHLLAAAAAGREVAGVSFVEATTDAWKHTTHFRSTEDGWFDQTVVQIGGGLRALAIAAGDVQRRSYPNSFRGQFSCGGWENVVALDLAGHAAATAGEAVALLDAPELPPGRRTVILESSQLALQVHESVGHATELDRILGMERAYAGTSFVDVADRGRLRYGSPLVTITADATTPGALGTFAYDDEGVAAGETTLIEAGVLVGFLTNRECAAVVGDRSNGTARADSWGSIPLIRMNNVSLQPREGDVESIVADTPDGVLLLTNKSWSIDDRRVNFQFSCEAAYEIVRGERGRLYKNPSYAGRTTDFWGSCDAIGGAADWRVWGVPNCGKGQPSQTARVGHGAATGRFQNITTGDGS